MDDRDRYRPLILVLDSEANVVGNLRVSENSLCDDCGKITHGPPISDDREYHEADGRACCFFVKPGGVGVTFSPTTSVGERTPAVGLRGPVPSVDMVDAPPVEVATMVDTAGARVANHGAAARETVHSIEEVLRRHKMIG